MKNAIQIILVLICFFVVSCTSKNPVADVNLPTNDNKFGMNLDREYLKHGNSLLSVLARIDSLANHGVRMVTIYKVLYTDGVNSYSLLEQFPSENPGWVNYSYSELAQMVNRAQNHGMLVQYAVEICPISYNGGWHNGYGEEWRGHYNPSRADFFFNNFTNKLKIDAQFCEYQGVDILNIGQENVLLTTPDKDAYWHALVDSIRTQYSGSISYVFNGGQYDIISRQFPYSEFNQVSSDFCANFDILGITMYPNISEEAIPSCDSLKNELVPIFNYLEQIHIQTGRSIIIGETSCPSVEYPLTRNYVSWAWNADRLIKKITNYQGQANYAKALMQLSINKVWLMGIFWHNSYYNPDNANNSLLLEKGPSPFGPGLEIKEMLK